MLPLWVLFLLVFSVIRVLRVNVSRLLRQQKCPTTFPILFYVVMQRFPKCAGSLAKADELLEVAPTLIFNVFLSAMLTFYEDCLLKVETIES